MTLVPGSRLGPYEIIGAIGAGGMGEVFRARDTKLNRDVAIKVLPEVLAQDTERVRRFRREAQILATLNHPNIAAIYGLEEGPSTGSEQALPGGPGQSAVVALVMELVSGEDLAERLRRGAIPVAEAIAIAKQIAEALEEAHEHGIVHRDLKPANVKVTPDGKVKVLDFGLAKALEGESAGATASSQLSHSPTMSRHATEAGLIFGTAAYMSPEQAKGKTVDKRADIWAFGVVLYEMLTGTRAFKGDDVSETLASVLKDTLSMDALPDTTPPRLKRLIERCLDRDLKTRLRDIGEARVKIARIEAGAPDASVASAPAAALPKRTALPWALVATLSVSLIAALLAWAPWRPAAEVRQTRFFVSPPDGWRVTNFVPGAGGTSAPLAVSPDGSRIAFLASAATGRSRLWVRALDTLTAQELPGTDGASSPFWSPDSRFLGFFADGKLKKIDVSGGPAVTLCDSPGSVGGTWSRDGVIVFSPGLTSALQKVSASGGVPSAATVLGEGETYHSRPSFFPDGRHFSYRVPGGPNDGIYVTSLDSPARTLLIKNADSNVRYARGHLLFLRETTLMAQPFDLDRLTLTGEPVPIADQVQTLGSPPNGLFSASDTGVLVYQTGIATGATTQLTWFDRTGKLLGTVEKPGPYNTVALSPDGTRVAISRVDSQAAGGGGQTGNTDLWVHEFARSTSTRLTFDPARDWMAVWSPDGSRIAWSSNRDGNDNLYQKVSNGAGTDEALLKSSDVKVAYDWSPDGRFLLHAVLAGARFELWVLPLTGDDRKPALYLQQTGFNVSQARFSPDSRFVAYTSNASGRSEVYVQPFPAAAGGKWMVSQGGGNQPRWRRDGKELFYIAAGSKVMAVQVAATPAFTPGVPKALFAAPIWGGGSTVNVTRYDVTADGQKFLIIALPPETTAAPPAPITVVLNWTAVKK